MDPTKNTKRAAKATPLRLVEHGTGWIALLNKIKLFSCSPVIGRLASDGTTLQENAEAYGTQVGFTGAASHLLRTKCGKKCVDIMTKHPFFAPLGMPRHCRLC